MSVPAGPSSFSLLLKASAGAEGSGKSASGSAPCDPGATLIFTHVVHAFCPGTLSARRDSFAQPEDHHAKLLQCYRAALARFHASVAAFESGNPEVFQPPAAAAEPPPPPPPSLPPPPAMQPEKPPSTFQGRGAGASGGGGGGGEPQFKPWSETLSIGWSQIRAQDCLLDYSRNVERYYESGPICFHGAEFFLLRDRFPKGHRHYLVLARSSHRAFDGVGDVGDLGTSHLAALEAMLEFARRCCSMVSGEWRGGEGGKGVLKVGFHARPSLYPLHLHIVSDDMAGESLKHKMHYMSFVTPFFCPLEQVIEGIRERGAYFAGALASSIEAREAQKSVELRVCHLCKKGRRHGVPIPSTKGGPEWLEFKKHLLTCAKISVRGGE
jgi:hypothetical protein